ncbi:MAG: hypothetical protein K2O22_01780 [Anaeroplasmataceae bacterium]|nr:hypothetical protein [Anaeroplasmataceae bacterium]
MKKITKIEIGITILLVLAEIITFSICYPESLHSNNTDSYLTAIIAFFINLDVIYALILIIVHNHFRLKNE